MKEPRARRWWRQRRDFRATEESRAEARRAERERRRAVAERREEWPNARRAARWEGEGGEEEGWWVVARRTATSVAAVAVVRVALSFRALMRVWSLLAIEKW